jgi:hypothetical protein
MSNEFSVTANFVASGQTNPTDVSAQMNTATSNTSFDAADAQILESLTITNTGGQYVSGPISVVLTKLSAGFTLSNATGSYNGSPYIRILNYGVLSPGQSYTAFLQFSVGPTAVIQFTPATYVGL